MNGGNRKRIDRARDVLVGIIPDPKGQVEQITTALIYKFMYEFERSFDGERSTFFAGKYAAFAWDKLLSPQTTGDERLRLYREAVETMAKNPKLPEVFREMLRGAHSPFRSAPVLSLFLKEIDGLDCDHTEDLGNAYEHLLSIMGTQGDAGQFRTPRHIIKFIVDVVNPKKGERILDPACGSAGFLTAAHKHIMDANTRKTRGDKLTQTEKENLQKHICGRDIDPGMTRLARVNLYLHDLRNPQIAEYDTLSDDSQWREKYEVILANPPFMTPKGGIVPHEKFQVRARRSEVLFVDYIAEHLTVNGRAGIIVPEGIIFQSARAYKELRKMLVSEWGLFAVASLPAGVFNPYSGVKTSVLFLDRARRSYKNILFVKIANDGFDLGAKQTPVDGSHLPEAKAVIGGWNGKKVKRKIAHVVAKKKIAEDGDYNLVGDRYREIAANVGGKYPMTKLGDYIEQKTARVGKKVADVFSVSNTKGFINPGELFGKKIASDEISNYKEVAPGDFAYNPARINVGSVAINASDKHGAVSPMYVVFRIKGVNLHLGYLLSLLKSKEGLRHIRKNSHGAVRQMLTFNGLSRIVIPLPPLEEQKRIVAEIGGYTEVRDGARKAANAWRPVVDVNPEWTMVKLGDVVVDMKDGGTPPRQRKECFGGDINWAVVKDITPEIYGTKETLTEKGLQNSSAKVWPIDSVIISLGATIGNVGVAKVPLATKQGLSGIVVDRTKMLPKFLYCILVGKRDVIQSLATGVAIKEIRPSRLQRILDIPLPPMAEQERIVAEMESERAAVAECRKLAEKMDGKIAAAIAKVWKG